MTWPRCPRVLAAAGSVLFVGLVLGACAIPTQNAPSTMAPSKVPFGLLNRNLPSTTTTQPSRSVSVAAYFLNTSSQLMAVQRYEAPPVPLSSVLSTMLQGPTDGEISQGIVTAIPKDVRVLSVSPDAGQSQKVTVNMNAAFEEIVGTNIEPAVAQIVATVACRNGSGTGVTFEIEGIPTSVPISNGQQANGPVTLQQYGEPLPSAVPCAP